MQECITVLGTAQPDTTSDLKSDYNSTDQITNFHQHTRDLVDSLLTADFCIDKLTVQYQANHKYVYVPGFIDQMRQWEQQHGEYTLKQLNNFGSYIN